MKEAKSVDALSLKVDETVVVGVPKLRPRPRSSSSRFRRLAAWTQLKPVPNWAVCGGSGAAGFPPLRCSLGSAKSVGRALYTLAAQQSAHGPPGASLVVGLVGSNQCRNVWVFIRVARWRALSAETR